MVGYEQEALVFYEPARIAAGKALTHIEYDGDAFWTVTAHHGRRRYYKISIVESEPGKPQPQLPKTGYIPTRGKNGAHVGLFYPKGC